MYYSIIVLQFLSIASKYVHFLRNDNALSSVNVFTATGSHSLLHDMHLCQGTSVISYACKDLHGRLYDILSPPFLNM